MERKPSAGSRVIAAAAIALCLLTSSMPVFAADASERATKMVVAIVTYKLQRPVTPGEVRRVGAKGAPRYLNLPGLLRKNYWLSEDGMQIGGIYVWESKARAEAFYSAEWKQFVTHQYGAAPEIVYLHSPVMVDNSAGRIVVDME